jgi:hypothetical protein
MLNISIILLLIPILLIGYFILKKFFLPWFESISISKLAIFVLKKRIFCIIYEIFFLFHRFLESFFSNIVNHILFPFHRMNEFQKKLENSERIYDKDETKKNGNTFNFLHFNTV